MEINSRDTQKPSLFFHLQHPFSKLLPMLIIFNQRKKISFLISTGKAEEVSCTIISNSVKSLVGHRQYKKIPKFTINNFGTEQCILPITMATDMKSWSIFFTEFTFLLTEMMFLRFRNGNEDNEMSKLIIEGVCQ